MSPDWYNIHVFCFSSIDSSHSNILSQHLKQAFYLMLRDHSHTRSLMIWGGNEIRSHIKLELPFQPFGLGPRLLQSLNERLKPLSIFRLYGGSISPTCSQGKQTQS